MSLVSLLVDPRLYASLVLATALMRVIYAVISRAVAPYPRLRALVESVAALMPDVVRATLQLAAVATGRPAPRLDLAPPDPAAVEWERRARAAEARVAELAATSPAAPVGHVDETTREGRATIAPGMHGMMVLLLVALAAGCASGGLPDAPGATLAKVHGWWSAICSSGDQALTLAERTVTTLPGADAGPSPGAPRDASATAESNGEAGAP